MCRYVWCGVVCIVCVVYFVYVVCRIGNWDEEKQLVVIQICSV